jgi:hypothetical protein
MYRSADGLTYDASAPPIAAKTITPNPAGGPGSDTIGIPNTPPFDPSLKYLVIVADPPTAAKHKGDIIESNDTTWPVTPNNNNQVSVLLPDIAITTLAWRADKIGLDFGYKVSGSNLTHATTAALYWSADDQYDATDTLAYEEPLQLQVNTYDPLIVFGSALATPPIGTANLLLVVDRNNLIGEADEMNNVRALAVPTSAEITQGALTTFRSAADIINTNTNQVTGQIQNAGINARFVPNYGFTLDTAAHLCGFDHFNWLQMITTDPEPPLAWSGQRPHVIYLDPPNGGYYNVPADNLPYYNLPADNLPYYYNESSHSQDPGAWDPVRYAAAAAREAAGAEDWNADGRPFKWRFDIADPEIRQPSALTFYDQPNGTGYTMAFTTFLVGVKPNGLNWHGLRAFTWQSNFTGTTGGVDDIVPVRLTEPYSVTSGTGGIFDLVPDVNILALPRSTRELMAARGDENVSLAGPLLDPIGNVTVNEGRQATVGITATDSDPNQTLNFRLDIAPPGASINPTTGILTWTPTDGPSTAQVTVRVTDNGSPALNDTKTFTITVNNVAPTATLGNSGPLTYGTSATVCFSNPLDLSSLDTATGFHYAFALDASGLATATYTNSGANPSVAFSFAAGDHTVYGRIIDKDDGYTQFQTTVTVNKATPAFSLLNAPTIIVGASSTTLSGKISLGSLIPTGNVTITVNGVSKLAAINPDGSFSESFATGTLSVGAYPISYSYDGDPNFTAATGLGTLNVTYNVTALFDQSKAKQAGSTIPIQLQLTNVYGTGVSAPNLAMTALGIASVSNPSVLLPAASPGNANPGNRFTSSGGKYQYNLKTSKDLAAGIYLFYFTIEGDPLVHSVQFEVK